MPLLIGQGANDPRVKQAERSRSSTRWRRTDVPVTYVLYPDEGHGFARPENRIDFYARAEAFLAKCLGWSRRGAAEGRQDRGLDRGGEGRHRQEVDVTG